MPSWELKDIVEKSLQQSNVRPIVWDAEENAFSVILPGAQITKSEDPSKSIQVKLTPPELYIVHIREKGKDDWGIGFLTPLNSLGFAQLKANQTYEMRVVAVDKDGNRIPDGSEWNSEFTTPTA